MLNSAPSTYSHKQQHFLSTYPSLNTPKISYLLFQKSKPALIKCTTYATGSPGVYTRDSAGGEREGGMEGWRERDGGREMERWRDGGDGEREMER
jgi:hypothetical protein